MPHLCFDRACTVCHPPTLCVPMSVEPTPTCRNHQTPMRYVATHGSTKGWWWCDQCETQAITKRAEAANRPRFVEPLIDQDALRQKLGTDLWESEKKDPTKAPPTRPAQTGQGWGPHWSELPLRVKRRRKR